MIPFTCPCCEVDRPPHRDGCTLHSDCPSEAATFDEVSSMRAEIARLREERRWIPVGERLPEEGKSVLVSTTRAEVEVAGYETFANGNLWWTMSSGDPVWVTHWMPLPAPPNGGEGD